MKAIEPLRLGSGEGEGIALEARDEGETAHVGGHVLTKRGARHLADWLNRWARPSRKVPQLWDRPAICEAFGIADSTLRSRWETHPRYPRPLPGVSARIWLADDVRAWESRYRRKPGRPPAK